MSEDHDETMGQLFDRGLKLRREVLGAEYVDNSMKNTNDFMMAFQHITTEWCWGYGWGRRGGLYGGWGWDGPYVSDETRIAVDLFDARSRTPIWARAASA